MGSLKNSSNCNIEAKETSKKTNSYCRIYESIPIGIAVLDCKGSCLQVNSRLCKILDCSEQELLGSGFKELLDFKEPGIAFLTPYGISLIPVLLNEHEHCFKKDGNEVWVSILPCFLIDSENRPNFVVFQIKDITRQKKDDISFRAPEISFDSIYDNLSEGITINEQVGKFLEVNNAICKKVGYSRDELLHKTATEFIAFESSKIFAEKVRELYLNGQATAQIQAISKSDDLLPVEISMWLIEYKGKQAVFSIISDIEE